MTNAFDNPPVPFHSPEWNAYMASAAWADLTQRVYTAWGGAYCQGCWTKNNLGIYHLTFERYGHEEPNDMVPLCTDCATSLYNTYVNSGAYESLRAATYALLKDKKRARRKFVLAEHDEQGNPIIRKKRFKDRIQWWLRLNTTGRVLASLGVLAALAALVPLSVFVFVVVVKILIWVFVIAVALAMILFALSIVGLVSMANIGAALTGGTTGRTSSNSGATKVVAPKVDWKITKDAAGNTLIQQDKVAAWARGGETYYQVTKDAAGNTILKQKTW